MDFSYFSIVFLFVKFVKITFIKITRKTQKFIHNSIMSRAFLKGFKEIKTVFSIGKKTKVIYIKYSKHSNETNTFMGLGRAGRFGQS